MASKIAKNHIIGARGGVVISPLGHLKPQWRQQKENCQILIWYFGQVTLQRTIFGLILKARFYIYAFWCLSHSDIRLARNSDRDFPRFFDFWHGFDTFARAFRWTSSDKVLVGIWKTLKEKTNFFVRNVTDYFLQYYPNSIILPVRSQLELIHTLIISVRGFKSVDSWKAIGNHEGVPVNQFEVGSNWLYQEIAEQWAKFNLHPDSFETIKR